MTQKYFFEKRGEKTSPKFLQKFNGSNVIDLKQAGAGFGYGEVPMLDM